MAHLNRVKALPEDGVNTRNDCNTVFFQQLIVPHCIYHCKLVAAYHLRTGE